jgi:cytochrome b involved in lipid metabolism
MIKKIVTFSLFVFASGMVGILLAGYLVSRQQNGSLTKGGNGNQALRTAVISGQAKPSADTSTPAGKPLTSVSPGQPAASASAGGSSASLNASDVAIHGTADSCWLVISNKVYDVSSYLNQHPAGAGAIIPYCGKEATAAFDGSSGGHAHSGSARKLLDSFYIGNLSQ